jgi:hypothetical protein
MNKGRDNTKKESLHLIQSGPNTAGLESLIKKDTEKRSLLNKKP